MPWSAAQNPDLVNRIDHWKQKVVNNTPQQVSANQLLWPDNDYNHHMKLRSQSTRPVPAEVSGNPNARKRKASAPMSDSAAIKKGKKGKEVYRDGYAQDSVTRQGPARSPKDVKAEVDRGMEQRRNRRDRSQIVPELTNTEAPAEAPSSVWSPSDSASSRKDAFSPSERCQITIDSVPSETLIDMEYLRRCDPPVKLTTFYDLRVGLKKVSSPVLGLHKRLQDVPTGLIPSTLRVSSSHSVAKTSQTLLTLPQTLYEQDANTPRKTRDLHAKSQYLNASQTPFPQHCLSRMKSTADHVLENARRTSRQQAHDKQWGAVVHQLLCEVEIWQDSPSRVLVLNV